jgi:glycosyltransferase involved in cell wall biosynthesis
MITKPAPRPLRVLILSPVADLYGSTRSMLEVVNRIDRSLLEPAWGVPDEGDLTRKLAADSVPYAVIPELRLARASDSTATQAGKLARRLPRGAIRIARLARRNSIDVIHSNSAAVVAGAYGSRLAGVPHLWYVRELIPEGGPFGALLRREIPARSDVVISNSRAVEAQFELENKPGRVIPCGIDWERLGTIPRDEAKGRIGIPANAIAIGSAGYLNPRKGMDVLLEAYARVREGVSEPTRLILAGAPFPGNEGFATRLRDRARDLGLADEVLMPGFIDDISVLLASLDVFALTTREPEGLGRVVIEAMAAGLPVIATAGGGILDVVDHEETGLLVDSPTPEDVASALGRLLGDERLRERLGEAARRSVEERFRLDLVADCLLASYRELRQV